MKLMNPTLLASGLILAAVSAASAADFYVAMDSAAKTCSVVEQKPDGKTMTALDSGKAFATREDANKAIVANADCNGAMTTAIAAPVAAPAPKSTAMATPAANATVAANSASAGSAAEGVNVLTTAPSDAVSIKQFSDQNVYDTTGAKVGEIKDVLIQNGDKLDAFVVSVGGFLGMGEKDVLVPVHAVKLSMKDGKTPWLTIDATKDELKAAPGVKLDSTKKWIAASAE